MIQNFDVIREQLKELAGVINSFKSEAVQLRLIELVFEAAERTPDQVPAGKPQDEAPRRKPRLKTAGHAEDPGPTKPKGMTRRTGGRAMLGRLLSEGFFKKPRTIKELVEHCDQKLAVKLKQSDFSGPLARMTRDVKLNRSKNSDKQYEYSEA